MLLSRSSGFGLAMSFTAVVVGFAGATGCATAPPDPAAPGNAVALERSLMDMRAQNSGYAREIEELQNRIFILENKLDNRYAAKPPVPPPPPVVTRIVVPPAEATTGSATGDAASAGEEPTTVVEYAGAAAVPLRRRTRPVLRLSGAGSPPPPRPTRTVASALPPPAAPLRDVPTPSRRQFRAGPLRVYHDSLDALYDGRHADALAGFRSFLASYQGHPYADNAQYWIGECYYDLKQYHAASREFRHVVERYPHGNKVPDAMLKLGYSRLATGDRRGGRQVLESLRRTYPRHAASQLALARLSSTANGEMTAEASGPAPAKITVGAVGPERPPGGP
jgi:tol-pal system protein YbgF